MTLESWDDTAKITYDRAVWSELVSLGFVDQARNAFILGPVGGGKTLLASALGHIACRRRVGVHFERRRPAAQAIEGGTSTPATTPRCECSSVSSSS
jgi:DNA replication protein DnaC